MAEKTIYGRSIQKHDTEANWIKATGFTPKQGEIIVYDIDENYTYERIKIGDGQTLVSSLPFVDDALRATLLEQISAVDDKVDAVSELVGDTSVATQINDAIADKADTEHTHDVATTTTNGFMSSDMATKLESIAEGAEVNVQSNWTENSTSSDAYIKNKPAIKAGSGLNSVQLNMLLQGSTGKGATGQYAVAEGWETTASGLYSHAEGGYTTASAERAHAEGGSVVASGYTAHAEGTYTVASGRSSHAEGHNTIAAKTAQHVEGRYNIEDTGRHSSSNGSYQYGLYIHIAGNGTSEDARSNAHTLDWDGNAWFSGDVYVGGTAQDSGEKLVKQSELPEAIAIDTTLAIEGQAADAKATGDAISNLNTLVGDTSVSSQITEALVSNQANWNQNDETAADYVKNRTHWIAYGEPTTIMAEQTVTGFSKRTYSTEATSPVQFSITPGNRYTVVFDGITYVCIGKRDESDSEYFTHYIGNAACLNGEDTGEPFAIQHYVYADTLYYCINAVLASDGNDATSHTVSVIEEVAEKHVVPRWLMPDGAYIGIAGNGMYSEIFNCITSTADGAYAHAEGYSTEANGDQSHAEGNNSVAHGYASHAEGNATEAYGAGSHSEGVRTVASSDAQHVQGKYNIEDADGTYLHIVGNGTGNLARSNAHTLDWDGNAWFAGDVYVGGTQQSEGEKLIKASELPVVDAELSTTSTNAVQNKVVTTAINELSTLVGDSPVADQIDSYMTDLGAITINLEGSTSTSPNPVNADTLGGYSVDDIIGRLNYYVTPQMYGAKGDGVTDDTAAIKSALLNSNYVFLPTGSYVVNEAIQIEQGKTLFGTGNTSIIVCKSTVDLIHLGAYTTIKDIAIVVESDGFTGSLLKVNHETLANSNVSITGNINVLMSGIDIVWNSYDYSQCANIELSLGGTWGDRVGFYGVTMRDIFSKANAERNVGYFLRTYCSYEGAWITGCTIENCSVIGCRWGVFMHTSDEDFTDPYESTASTNGIDELAMIRYQHQCCSNTKGFVYFRKNTRAQLTNCCAWDWHYATDEYNKKPYCIDYNRLFSDTPTNAKIEISPAPAVNEFVGIKSDGTITATDYDNEYHIAKNVGLDNWDVDLVAKELGLKNNTYGACIFHTTSSLDLNKIMAGSTEFRVAFQLFDTDKALKTVIVNLHPTTPTITVDYPLSSDTKFGYKKTDTDFKLFIYHPTANYKFIYAYLLSLPLQNQLLGYDEGIKQYMYNKTINTFGMGEDRNLTSAPTDIVEITSVNSLVTSAINSALSAIGVAEGSAY